MPAYTAQHYVQRAYLEHFAKNGQVFVYDKQLNKQFAQSPSGVAYSRDFYELPTATGPDGKPIPRATVEQALSRLESSFAPALTKVLEKLDTDQKLDPAQKEILALFIFVQRIRVGRHSTVDVP
jgi:hypothetical protein